MNSRYLFVIALTFLMPVFLSGQAQKAWTPAHTPDGQPDIQGIWTNAILTPLERPQNCETKSSSPRMRLRNMKSRLGNEITAIDATTIPKPTSRRVTTISGGTVERRSYRRGAHRSLQIRPMEEF